MYQYGGVDIRVLKEILGHENLGTTEIYTHLSSKQMLEAAEKNPLAHITPSPSQTVDKEMKEKAKSKKKDRLKNTAHLAQCFLTIINYP